MLLSATLANDQLDAQIFNIFVTILCMYMFRAISCSSSGGQIVSIQRLLSSLSVSDRPLHGLKQNAFLFQPVHRTGARGGVVGLYTALQAGGSRVRFPMVSLEFFIGVILPAALWPLELTQPLTEMSTRNISWR
jgi:hypothetical protein